MKKLYGYLFAGLGLFGLALNSVAGRKIFPFLENVNSNVLLIPAAIFFVIGMVIMIVTGKKTGSKSGGKGGKDKIEQVHSEVPIYQGEGKDRKIVGYKAEE